MCLAQVVYDIIHKLFIFKSLKNHLSLILVFETTLAQKIETGNKNYNIPFKITKLVQNFSVTGNVFILEMFYLNTVWPFIKKWKKYSVEPPILLTFGYKHPVSG